MPAETATAMPGSTSATAASAMASFSLCWSADLAANPGSNSAVPAIEVAPPWTFSSSPCSSRISRSRRTVMSETPSSRTRSATRTAPSSRTRSRMKAWRWRASIRAPSARRRDLVSIPNDLPLLIRQIAAQRTESQRIPTNTEHEPLQNLDTGGCGWDNPPDPVGFCRAASEEEYAMADPTRDAVSRRTVLKGMAGAAGLVSVPAIIAACSTPAASGGERATGRHVGRQCAGGDGRRQRRHRLGHLRFELLEPRHRHQGDAGRRRRLHRQDRHRGQGQHRRPQHVPGPDQLVPAGHAGRHLHLVRRLPDALLRRPGPGDGHQRRLGEDRSQLSARRSRPPRPATTGSSTSSRSTTTRGSSSTARASSRRRATRSPRPSTEFKALGDKMQADGLIPLAFADKDGWPAMGTFDILNMRLNGYQFHIDLMAGAEKWTDPKTAAVFEAWKGILPYSGDIAAALGRTWQDAANAARPEEGRDVLPGHLRRPAGDRDRRPRRPRLLPVPDASARSSTPSSASTRRSTAS